MRIVFFLRVFISPAAGFSVSKKIEVAAVLLFCERLGWNKKIDITIKAFCFATFYRLSRAFFLFLDEKKQKSRAAEKKAPDSLRPLWDT